MLTGIYRTRAGLAADGNEPAIVQRVVRDVIVADVSPDLRRRPETERVELHEWPLGRAERAIELNDRNIGARARALVLTLSGDPGLERRERAHQRLDFPDAAAFLVAV